MFGSCEFRRRSRKPEIEACCTLPSHINTLPALLWPLSIQAAAPFVAVLAVPVFGAYWFFQFAVEGLLLFTEVPVAPML